MSSDALALFREVADRSPAEREQYYESTRDLARELKAAANAPSTLGVKPVTTGTFRWSRRAVAAAALALVAAVAPRSFETETAGRSCDEQRFHDVDVLGRQSIAV